MELDALRPALKKTSSCASMMANWNDSSDGNDEGEEADVLVVVDLRGEAPSGGGVRVTAAVLGGQCELGLGFRGKRGGNE